MKTNKDILKNEEERKERNRSSYSELPDEDESLPEKITKKDQNKNNKEIKESKGLRRSKTHKEKNDPDRFKGDGVNFKAKIIGIESVDDARGNKMCQEALQKLKGAVKISGEHKQRIILNISLCGIRIKDEKTGEQLHHHPVHKISFISQDTGDNRAFGYVFGCPQSGHQFFGIKTEKTASQVVITLRDLFQVALELKKKEIEKAIELRKESQDASDQFKHPNVESQPVTPESENVTPDQTENKATPEEEKPEILEEPVYCDVISIHEEEEEEEIKKAEETILPDLPIESQSTVNNLLDLQFEMDSLQQGITQMDNSIASAASLGFGVSFSEDDNSVSSGNSFVMTPRKFDRLSSLYHETLSISSRSSSTSEYNIYPQETKCEDFDNAQKSIEAPKNNPTPPPQNPSVSTINNIDDKYAVFQNIDSLPSVFDNPIVPLSESNEDSKEIGILPELNGVRDEISTIEGDKMQQAGKPIDAVFAELDPLGDHPYVDKENFFYEIKNPPKKVLKDLIGDGSGKNSSFSESDSTSCCMQINGFSETVTVNGDSLSNPFMLSKDTTSLPTSPPKLPPKRSFSVTSPLPYTPSLKNDLPIPNEESAFDFKNPFNPFINGVEIPDVPPPNSPPPPPPPRLPVKGCEPVCVTSPPPRPPSRTCGTPTPPLPRRKPPLSSSGRAWYSFDHDVSSSWPSVQHQPNQETYISSSSPPIPVPSRKLPAVNKCDSPIHKSSSATSSPAISRRFLNYGPCSSNPALSKEISENGKQNIVTPNRKILSRHGSVAQDAWNEKLPNDVSPQTNAMKNPFTESSPSHAIGAKHHTDSILSLTRSPPLPPKSISRPRPSPSKKMLAVASVSLSSSNSSVAEGTNDSHSTSSLHFGSFEEGKNDSATDILYGNSTDSQSDDIFSNGHNDEMSIQSVATENGHEENATSLSPTSPDSIFRRKSDPFADDFFLSLPKKSTNVNGSLAITSITGETQCTNGFQADCEESKDSLYSHINKSKKEIS